MESQAVLSPTNESMSQRHPGNGGAERAWYAFLVLMVALWGRLFWSLRVEWEIDPQYAHGWFIPILGGLLLLGRWKDRPEPNVPGRGRWLFAVSLLGLLALLPVKLLGVVYPEARPFQWIHGAIAVGVTLAGFWSFGGSRWLRHFAFPILFFLVSIPWARGFQNDITNRLMHSAASVSVELVLLSGIPAVQEGNTITLGGEVVGVDEACSGIRSLQGSIMVGLFLGEFLRLGAVARIFLLCSAVGLSLLLNIARAAILTWICASSGTEGLAKFHDPAGLAILIVVFVLSVALAMLLARGNDTQPTDALSSFRPLLPRWTYGLSLAALVWLALVEIGVTAYFRTPPQPHGNLADWKLDYSQLKADVSNETLSPTARQYLRFDAGESKVVDFSNGDLIRVIDLSWRGGEISAAGAHTHSPTICLPALGYELGEVLPTLSFPLGALDCQFKVASFEKRGHVAYVYHSIWEDGVPATFAAAAGDQSFKSAISAVASRRRLGETRMLLVLVSGPETPADANRALQDFLKGTLTFSLSH